MPFDGTAASKVTRAVLMLDYLTEFFAEGRSLASGWTPTGAEKQARPALCRP